MRAGPSDSGAGRIPRTRSDGVAVGLAAAAALIPVVLFPEHLRESLLFGAGFAALALFQVGIAWALWTHPYPTVRTVGRYGSRAIVVLFLGTRIISPRSGGSRKRDLERRPEPHIRGGGGDSAGGWAAAELASSEADQAFGHASASPESPSCSSTRSLRAI